MTVALLYPEVLRTLTVADIAPVSYSSSDPQWDDVRSIIRAVSDSDPTLWSSRKEADAALAEKIPVRRRGEAARR